jgi:hypothetical protein
LDLKKAHKSGEGPATLAEKRALEQTRRDQEEEEAEAKGLDVEGITFSEFFEKTYLPAAKISKGPGSLKAEDILYEKWL